MADYLLLVKGHETHARNAARERGIGGWFIGYDALRNETRWAITDADFVSACKWFAEPPRCAPYPLGTLLFLNPRVYCAACGEDYPCSSVNDRTLVPTERAEHRASKAALGSIIANLTAAHHIGSSS